MRNYYAQLTSVSNPNPLIIAFDSDCNREEALKVAHLIGAQLKPLYTKDVKPHHREQAVRLDWSNKACGSWYQFIRGGAKALGYDFGHPIGDCQDCQRRTQHTETGECVLCEKRNYQLSIWVRPRQSEHDGQEIFDPTEGYKKELRWNRVSSRTRAVRFDETAKGVRELSSLIIKARRKELRENVYAIVTHDIMENRQISIPIANCSLSELNIAGIRWYYVADANGIIKYFTAKVPPHWDMSRLHV